MTSTNQKLQTIRLALNQFNDLASKEEARLLKEAKIRYTGNAYPCCDNHRIYNDALNALYELEKEFLK